MLLLRSIASSTLTSLLCTINEYRLCLMKDQHFLEGLNRYQMGLAFRKGNVVHEDLPISKFNKIKLVSSKRSFPI